MSWVGHSAIDIARAVRRGEVTAPEVVGAHLEEITGRNRETGAFRVIREQALDEARALQERDDLSRLPLAGVPVAIKDNVAVAGEVVRNGSAATSGEPASADHPVVARLRAAGAIVVGLTATPELSLVALGDSVYGTARNPWDLTRTPGGSSSGSAAAVAAGLVPLALGTDGLGSLRIPAACCGVLTLKPGPGLVPPPEDDWFGMAEIGPMATTAADLALALAVISDDMALATAWETGERRRMAWEPDSPSDAGAVSPQALRGWREGPFDLRIAVASRPLPPGFRIDPEFRAAATAAGEALRTAGHTVVERERHLPPWLGPAAVATWFRCAAQQTRGLDRRRLERRTRALARAGRVLGAIRLDGARGMDRWRAYEADRWFGDADVLVTPALAAPPPAAARWGERGLLRNVLVHLRYAPVTAPWNLAAWPAMAVPFGRHSCGLPIGVQLIAPPGGEPHLLGLAAQLEKALPHPRHAPTARRTQTA
ncbi:amidase [Thermostaphylospora chromogena]|uniref:Amidase n=1 Tax=Thermostaphylospora chromogena TaxID=35622 RepID=A0A1H1DT32_9ACTN|nr:amidase family protein [Thermostaphylospora chromogena]SDQ79066.1 amidase [Thermostaphylospora chromogena]